MSDPPLDKEKFSDPLLDKIRSALTVYGSRVRLTETFS